MSAPLDVFRKAQSLDLTVEADGGDLVVKPRSKCPVEFVAELKQHKAELMDWLCRVPCPAWQAVPPGTLPLNPVMPRPTPENRERVIAYLLRQGCDRPGVLTAWLVRRENSYYAGPGGRWDCGLICYAAARDAACWQLNQAEGKVWELLDATAEARQCGRG